MGRLEPFSRGQRAVANGWRADLRRNHGERRGCADSGHSPSQDVLALGSAYGQLVEPQSEGVTETIWGAALLYTVELMESEPLPEAVRPEYLTEALRRTGALSDGRVVNVVVESSEATILSRIIRLSLSYGGVASDAPDSLILKTRLRDHADAQWSSGRLEVEFYTQIAASMSAPLLPRCFDSVWDND